MIQPAADTVELLRTLVAFDTTSRNSNLELIDFVRARLEAAGAGCRLVASPDRSKANLYATVGPEGIGGVMLSGHSDVVPVDGQQWSSDPFVLSAREGRLHGRGSCDMKGFIACVLAAVPAFATAPLRQPLHIAISYDEEVGCLGVPGLIEAIRALPVQPRLCIVGEPTSMEVAIGHKGCRAYRARFTGRAAHSSLAPGSVNAVEYAAEFITRLTALGRRYAAQGPFDPAYDVPHTTVHTGVIRGGTQVNIVPERCDVEFEFRNLPRDDPDAIEAGIAGWLGGDLDEEMRRRDPACGAQLERRYAYPGLDMAPDAALVTLVKALTGNAGHGAIAFGTEAGSFRQGLGIPAVVCGPGSIRQAHQPDEFVSLEQLARCERFLEALRGHMCRAGG